MTEINIGGLIFQSYAVAIVFLLLRVNARN